MLDWLCRMLSLPDHFLSGEEGGGLIQVGRMSEEHITVSNYIFNKPNLAINQLVVIKVAMCYIMPLD